MSSEVISEARAVDDVASIASGTSSFGCTPDTPERNR